MEPTIPPAKELSPFDLLSPFTDQAKIHVIELKIADECNAFIKEFTSKTPSALRDLLLGINHLAAQRPLVYIYMPKTTTTAITSAKQPKALAMH